jgi:AraC-like DNA-binding protein
MILSWHLLQQRRGILHLLSGLSGERMNLTVGAPPMKSRARQHTITVWSRQDMLFELYAYAPGPAEALPKHVHDEYQFCLSVDFPGEYYYRGTYYPVPTRSLSVIHPGEMHAARDLEYRQHSTTFRVVYATPDLLQTVATQVAERTTSLPFFATPIIVDEGLAQLFLRFHVAQEAAVSRLAWDSLLLRMLGQFIQRYADTRPAHAFRGRERQRVQRVREYLHEHYAENVSLDHLAQVASVSPYHLHRLFCQEVGLPPHQYQTQVRVAHAKTLLAQGLPISQVALATGFADQSHLTRHFKRLVQVTPGRYLVQKSKNVQDTAG